MPTGYTADLYEGKDISPREFILRCARGMGACIMQRDDSMDEAPAEQKPHTAYHDEAIERHRQEIAELALMSDEGIAAKAEAERQARVDRWHKEQENKRALHRRYEDMLIAISQWQPPTVEHEGLAKLMHEQITESIRFDCGSIYDRPTDDPHFESFYAVPDFSEYRQARIEEALGGIAYHEKARAEEIERTETRNQWVRDLYNSLENI